MIKVERISKTYPTGKEANKNISFTVCPGEIVALIGPNGSGKTTLMQQMLGVLGIMKGEILIDGNRDCSENIAYVPQFPAIYPSLTVYESLKLICMYNNLKKSEVGEVIECALRRTGLSDNRNQPCYTLSGGQKKLLSFAGVLVQDSPNLVLDEVTSMVDVVTKERIWDLIIEEQKKGKAILISSHDLSEVKKLSTKLVVLKDGEVIFNGAPSDLTEKYCQVKIRTTDMETVKNIALIRNLSVNLEENIIGLISDTLENMISAVSEISKECNILEISWEFPAIYEGLINLMRKESNK